jgi:rod shape-determining protein MreD
MRVRSAVIVFGLLLLAIVLQTTLFSQTAIFTPSVVLLVVIMLGLTKIRPELVLGLAFASGLAVDLLGSAVLGLRAMVFTMVAYLALRTRDRADVGRIVTGVWAGLLTLAGVMLLILIGTLFGQTVLLGEGVLDQLFLVPISNMIFAWIFAPAFVRLVDRDSTAFRYV